MSQKRNKKNVSAAAVIVVAVIIIILAAALIFIFGGSGEALSNIKNDVVGDNVDGKHNDVGEDLIGSSELPDATVPVQETAAEGSTVITLSDGGINIEGPGAVADGSYLKIVNGGTYSISGSLSDGRIAVRAKGEDVVLILNGVSVSCSDSAPLYVNKAESVTLLLNGSAENVFTDGTSYDYSLEYGDAAAEEPNACIFSKADLIIRGTGSLKVNANYNSGIIGKDTLQILNTTVTVDAKNNGINGKDSLTVQNSTLSVTAGGDALRSTQENDPNLGWANFVDSNVYLVSGEDGMQIERGITVTNCSMSVKAGYGATSVPTDTSQKGLKSVQGCITVNSGSLVIDSTDDAFHSAGDINVNGGDISVATGDDAVHSDANIYISGGKLDIPDCHEGLEGALIEVSGGEVYIVADDDGINSSGGTDASSADMRGAFMSDGSYLGISGGYVYINSQGDGIDSNGDIYMSGGTLIISGPEREGDGAIDYNGDFHADGGLLFAAGSAGMAQAPDNMMINAISVTFDKTLDAGTYICISGEGSEFVFQLEKQAGNIVFSSPELKTGGEYTVSYGGKFSGEVESCVCSGGKYSGGTELATVTITEGLNSYGRVGIGGTMGGAGFGEAGRFGGMGGEGHRSPFGGRGGQGDPNGQGGNPPEPPQGETPPEGEAPPEPPQ